MRDAKHNVDEYERGGLPRARPNKEGAALIESVSGRGGQHEPAISKHGPAAEQQPHTVEEFGRVHFVVNQAEVRASTRERTLEPATQSRELGRRRVACAARTFSGTHEQADFRCESTQRAQQSEQSPVRTSTLQVLLMRNEDPDFGACGRLGLLHVLLHHLHAEHIRK